jgi:hypothetical protein
MLSFQLLQASHPGTTLNPNHPLKPLRRNLLLRRRNHSRRIRIRKPTSRLSILQTSRLSAAHAVARSSDLGAARRAAVGVGHAAAGDELRAVAGTDVLGTRVIGCDLREGGGGDWVGKLVGYGDGSGIGKRSGRTRDEGGDGETHDDGW